MIRKIVLWSLATVLLLLTMAVPVIAIGYLTGADILDGSIGARDLKSGSVNSSKIRDYTVRKIDIAKDAVNSIKIQDGAIKNADIAVGASISASKINKYGFDADLLDGKHASSFALLGHSHDTTKTGYLSIPVTELSPIDESYAYYKRNVLYMNTGSADFYGAVHLPQSAEIKKLTYSVADNTDTAFTQAKLQRISSADPGSVTELASVSTSGAVSSPAWNQISTTTIGSPIIDNNSFSYVINVYLSGPTSSLAAGPIVIEYSYTTGD